MLVEPDRMNEKDDHTGPGPCQSAAAAAASSPLQLSTSVVVSIPEPSSGVDGQRRIHRVPPEMRLKKKETQHLFDPVVVSLGPYHHGEANLSRAEKLKDVILSKFLSESSKDKDFFYNKIVERIDEIRACYVEVSKEKFDDKQLAEMMLRDTVFIIYVFIISHNAQYVADNLGISGLAFLGQDYRKLENQIPYSVLKLLLELRFEETQAKELICKLLSLFCFGDDCLIQLPWEDDGDEPLHLLDAVRMTYLMDKGISKFRLQRSNETGHFFETHCNPFHSVTALVAEGIRLKPSSYCLTDLEFSSYTCYGLLQLPKKYVSATTKVFLSNVVAFEVSPGSNTKLEVTSYINFMKSLIESSNDVKKLREKKILFSCLGSDEEVVELFKQIDTLGMGNFHIFHKVNMDIDEHCSSRRRTWMADLIRTYFESPWSAIALLAASLLLFLTFSQTYLALISHMFEDRKPPR